MPKEPSVTSGAGADDLDISAGRITAEDHKAIDATLDEVLAEEENNPPPPDPKTPPDPKDDSGALDDIIPPEPGAEPKPPTPPAKPATPTPPKPAKKAAAPAKPAKGTETPPAEPKPPTEPPAAPATPPVEPPKGEHDKEIDGIAEPKGMNPQNQSNWKALRETARKYKKQYEEAVNAAADLEKKVGGIPEAIKIELEELRSFRRTFDIEKDPEFVAKYDSVIEKNDTEVYDLLQKRGLKKEVIDHIKANGGLSNKPLKWWEEIETETTNEKGEKVVNKSPGFLKLLRESSNPEDNAAAIVIENKLKQNLQLQYDKRKDVQNASNTQSEWHKKREEETKKKRDEELTIMQKRIDEIQASVPWAKLQEIPKDATPEEKARIEKENAFYKESEVRFQHALFPETPLARVETAIAACLAFKYAQDNEELANENTALREEITKLKAAGQTHNKGRNAPPVTSKKKEEDRSKMSDSDAIDAGLDEAMANS